MNEILIALIAALSAILRGALSGFATYKAAIVGLKQQQKNRQLLISHEDLELLKEVEEIFLQRAAQNEQVNIVSLKRQLRFDVQEKLGDITFIQTQEGWLYLATMIDLFNRQVVGWQVSTKIDQVLVNDALNSALLTRGKPSGVIVHTDRGYVLTHLKPSLQTTAVYGA